MVWWTSLITAKVSSVPCGLLAESGKSSSSPPKYCLEISRTASWKATTSPHSICSSPGQAAIASSRSRSSSSGLFSRTALRRTHIRGIPVREETPDELDLDLHEAIAAWPGEEQMLWGEVVAFQEAVRLISRQYLGGEELLFPDSANRLQATLDTLAVMRDVHRTIVGRRPPQSE